MKRNHRLTVGLALLSAIATALAACQPATSPTPAPTTTPVVSATIAALYVIPSTDVTLVQPETTVAIRYKADVLPAMVKPDLFKVVGDKSGLHEGMAVLSDDQKTIIFKPTSPFTIGESVAVQFAGGLLGTNHELFVSKDFKFSIRPFATVKPASPFDTPTPTAPGAPTVTPTITPTPKPTLAAGATAVPKEPVPEYHFATVTETIPYISVTNHLTKADNNYIFLGTGSAIMTGTSYLMILDGSGGWSTTRR